MSSAVNEGRDLRRPDALRPGFWSTGSLRVAGNPPGAWVLVAVAENVSVLDPFAWLCAAVRHLARSATGRAQVQGPIVIQQDRRREQLSLHCGEPLARLGACTHVQWSLTTRPVRWLPSATVCGARQCRCPARGRP